MTFKKHIKAGLLTILLLLITAIGILLYYAKNNAEKSLESLVDSQSKGKLELTVKKVKVDLLNLSFEFEQPRIHTKDSLTAETGYDIHTDNIRFRLSSLFSFILKRKIVVESIIITRPAITVIKYKAGKHEKTSVTKEIGIVYQSLESVLEVVELSYLNIDNASFTLVDKTPASTAPIVLNNLYLTINKAKVDSKRSSDRFLYTDNIQFESFNQSLQLNDGQNTLYYKHLIISSGNKFLKLDSCHFSMGNTDDSKNKLDVKLDSITVLNVDYNLLLKESLLKLDSAVCYNPKINLELDLSEKKKRSGVLVDSLVNKTKVENFIRKSFGNIDIGYLAVKRANVKVATHRGSKTSNFASEKINISFTKLFVVEDPSKPLGLEKFALAVKNYTAFTPDSLYTYRFDSVIVVKRSVALSNFSFVPTKKFRRGIVNSILANSFELNDIVWNDLLYNQELIADNITLIKPRVEMTLPEPGNKKQTLDSAQSKESFTMLRSKIKINNFILEDGSVNIDIGKNRSAMVANCNANVQVKQFLKDVSLPNFITALTSLSFKQGSYTSGNTDHLITGFNYNTDNSRLYISKFSLKDSVKATNLRMEEISLSAIKVNGKNDFSVDSIGWSRADLSMQQKSAKKDDAVSSPKSGVSINVNHLAGGPTNLNVKTPGLTITTSISAISTGQIQVVPGKKPVIQNLHVEGKQLAFSQKKLSGSVTTYLVNDKGISQLTNVKLNIETARENLKVKVPELKFSPDINKSLNGLPAFDYLTVVTPEISFEASNAVGGSAPVAKKAIPKFEIGSLEIIEPRFVSRPQKLSESMQLLVGSTNLKVTGLSSDGNNFAAKKINVRLRDVAFRNERIQLIPTGNETIQVEASDISVAMRANAKPQWQFTIDTVVAANIIIHTLRKKEAEVDSASQAAQNEQSKTQLHHMIKKLDFQLDSKDDSISVSYKERINLQQDTLQQVITITRLAFGNCKLSSQQEGSISEWIDFNPDFSVYNSTVELKNNKIRLGFENLSYDAKQLLLKMDKFHFEPSMTEEEFMSLQPIQKSYMKLSTGKIVAYNFNYSNVINNKTIQIQKMNIDSSQLYVYKDKRLPFNSIEKPMLTELVLNMPFKTKIDTINLTNASIGYNETNDKTLMNGTVSFNNLKGRFTNFKNYDLTAADSLKFKVSSTFMNTTTLKVNYAQSYLDSLSAFTMAVHVSPFDLTTLNPLLVPTVSARINDGYLDTLSMNAIGRKYVSWGVMKMYYHDLDFQYLNKGDEEHKSFKSRAVSLVASTIVNKRNTRGEGAVYAERVYDKGFTNYWLKILLSGVLTNTGIRTNKKQEKKYYQSIRKYQVPPIPDVTLD